MANADYPRTGICRDCGGVTVGGKAGRIPGRCRACTPTRTPCGACGGPRPIGHVGRYCSATCRPQCLVGVCLKVARKNGYCDNHNHALQKHGDPLGAKYTWSTEARCEACGQTRAELGALWISNLRRWCSARCERIWRRYEGAIPEGFPCRSCAAWVPYQEEGRKRRRDDSQQCSDCAHVSRYELTAWQIAARDGDTCRLCGDPVDLSRAYPDPMSASADHIVPRSRGGGHEAGNLQLAHWICNVRRKDRPLEEVVLIHG